MKSRDEILRDNLLTKHLSSLGLKARGQGVQRTMTRCAATQHRKDHYCVSIDTSKQIWFCHDCKIGGSLIDWLVHERNQSVADVIKALSGESPAHAPTSAPKIVAVYDYTNESGEMVYQVVRLEPKDFRQRQPDDKGGWIWNMEGVTRVLYNLPALLAAQTAAICEGERDCDTLNSMGYAATCNVGGAGKWLTAYAEKFKGKDVLIFPDGDASGKKHGVDILATLDGVANSVKVVPMPEPYKDVTDFSGSFQDKEAAIRELKALIDKVAHAVRPLPIYSIREMEQQYFEHAKRHAKESFDLSKFLPEFRQYLPPLVPGEMLLILGDTGIGKTCILQSILRSAAPLPSLMFELELPISLMFERMVQQEVGCFRSDVQEEYRNHSVPLWKKYRGFHHVMVCPESGLTVAQVESFIVRSELKFGTRPTLVAVDYVGLVKGENSRSRYERVSGVAEEFKIIAKRTETIVILTSQIGRPDKKKDDLVVNLHDAKDSGSLECSAGLVLGVWRPERTRLMIKILKATSGESGATLEARIDGATMRITPA